MNLKRDIIIFFISLIILVIDQISKKKMLLFFALNTIYTYKVTFFLNFIEVWNAGISFGIFSQYNLSPVFLIFTSSIILILLLLLLTNFNPVIKGMIIGGAISNLIDRILFGQVFDFIDS